MYFSVITAASRPRAVLERLISQFQAQSYADFEHVVVYDGPPPPDVMELFHSVMHRDPRYQFTWLPERDGRYGTAPRNRGLELASGQFIVFADDDDLYHPDYLRALRHAARNDRTLGVVRMNDYGTVLPRHKMKEFPRASHVGTPSCAFPSAWFKGERGLRWEYEGNYDHDFQLVKRAVEQFRPRVRLNPRVVVKTANDKRMTEAGLTGAARDAYLHWGDGTWVERWLGPTRSDAWLVRKLYGLARRMKKAVSFHANRS